MMKKLVSCLAVAGSVIVSLPVAAAETMKWGVNAAVGSFTNLYETQENYKSVVEKIRKDTDLVVETSPLYSSFVKTALEKKISISCLFIPTNSSRS